jgi:urea transport system substrate-binding protein
MAGIVRVALVVPLSGTLGLIGPGAVNCAALAAREINEAGGILGRAVELRLVDGGRPALEVAIELRTLVRRGEAQAVVGVHSSDVRVALVSALGATVPYVYTPPYEGGERAPGVYLACTRTCRSSTSTG